jgi:hypothetical protein
MHGIRSYHGFTSLVQISTVDCDYIIGTGDPLFSPSFLDHVHRSSRNIYFSLFSADAIALWDEMITLKSIFEDENIIKVG